MSKPKLALIPSGYKSGKVYSILPNDASGDFDFTRQSIGTRVRKDGLIEEAKTVGSITNILQRSEEFNNSYWSKQGGCTVTSNTTLAPNGTFTADTLSGATGTSVGGTVLRRNVVISGISTLSIYVKSLGSTNFTIYIRNGANGQVFSQSITPNSDWQRVTLTTDPANGQVFFGNTNGDVAIWGAMLSEGALSDYIKTEGSSETKTVETFTDVPRLDWLNSNCPSLLLEPQRTNLILYSEEFTGSNWGTLNTLINSDTVISPNGTMTANTLQRTSTSASYRSHNISKSASSITYTTSTFIKKGSDNYFSMRAQGSYPSRADFRFRFDTEEIYYTQAFSNFTILDYGVDNYSNGWYRLHFTYTSDTHTNLSITFSPRSTDGNIDNSDTSDNSFAYVWGAQTEVANYVSSYIKTETSTVTRLKDECINGGDSDLFDITEGTFFVDILPYINSSSNHYISLNDGGNSDRFVFIFQSYGTQVRLFASSGGFNIISHYQNITFYQRNKLAVTFKEDEFKFYVNGSLVNTVTSGSMPTGLNQLDFSEHNGNRNFEGKIHDTRVYDRVLTEAEAIELTK
jgi:hypothetical protein